MAEPGTSEGVELLAASLARARGERFFPVLVEHIALVLSAGEVLICEVSPNQRARTLAAWRAGAPVPNYAYDLAGTPCARVLSGETLTIELSPGDYPGAPQHYRAYFGMPLSANDGSVLGHLCAYAAWPMKLNTSGLAVCDVLANRIAAELRLVHVKRERAMLRAERRHLRAEIAAGQQAEGMVGNSAAFQRVREALRRAAPVSAPVLISGEPGTGKEFAARLIHASGPRAAKPFVKIDCTALSIEAELSGLEETLDLAAGGTLFLDEVGALALEMQSRLLGKLPQTHGSHRDAQVADVRVIAATNRDLVRQMREGNFREELFYRLNVLPIEIPPLRARVEDIPLLAQSFVRKCARRLDRSVETIDPDSLAELAQYAWPGNIRELANLVERTMVMHDAPVLKITKDSLAATAPTERLALIAAAANHPLDTLRATLAGQVDFDTTLSTGLHVVQREHILRVLDATHWVIEGNGGAALKLGLKPATLRHRMKKLGISRAANARPT